MGAQGGRRAGARLRGHSDGRRGGLAERRSPVSGLSAEGGRVVTVKERELPAAKERVACHLCGNWFDDDTGSLPEGICNDCADGLEAGA